MPSAARHLPRLITAAMLVGGVVAAGCLSPGATPPTKPAASPQQSQPSPSPRIISPGGSPSAYPTVNPTLRPDSLPFELLSVKGVMRVEDEQRKRIWRITGTEALNAFLDRHQVSAEGRPAVDFATKEVLAVPVMGGACQGETIVGLLDGASLRVVLAPYDQGCMNAVGPSPLYGLMAIGRTDKPVEGAEPFPEGN